MRKSLPRIPLLKTHFLPIALSLAIAFLLLFCGGGPLAQTPKPPEGGATNSPERQIAVRPAPTPLESAAEKRTALVIGNGAYAQGPLKNPVNDAKAMAKALRECGFDVILKTDCNLEQMEAAVADFGKRIRAGGDAALFYYAGHGIQVDGRNYLVPVGVDVDAENKVKFRCLDSGLALAEMENAANRVSIVILDACRNNPFARSWRSSSQGLAVMEAAEGTVIAYSTSPGKMAADGQGEHSFYTESLLKHLRTPVSILDVFTNVRRDVMTATKKAQTPWEATSLTGKFYFVKPGGPLSLVPAPAATPAIPVSPAPTPPGAGKEPMTVDLGGGVKMELVWVPQRGADGGFWMGKYEVTNAQYQQFVKDSGYNGASDADSDYLKHFRGEDNQPTDGNYPVVWVSWKNTKAFCLWLSKKTGGTCVLPSVAQWTYACLAGRTGDYGFVGGKNNLGLYAWYFSNSDGHTHPVGKMMPNAWALYDMHGNVWEWCEDEEEGGRALRGGGWDGNADFSSVSCLQGRTPSRAYDDSGFRVVCVSRTQ